MKNESLKQKQISQKIIPPVAKNRKIHMNTEIENARVDFNALNHPEKSINKYDTGDGSEWEKEFFTNISDYDSSSTYFSAKYFCSTVVSSQGISKLCFLITEWVHQFSSNVTFDKQL